LQGVRNPGFLHAPAKNLLDLLRYFFSSYKDNDISTFYMIAS